MFSSGGFQFDFGASPSDEMATSGRSPHDAGNTNVLSDYYSVADLQQVWAPRFPDAKAVPVRLNSSIEVLTQVAPHVPALEGETERRDMVPGTYLGGLKIWSCAADVATYLMSRQDDQLAAKLRPPGGDLLPPRSCRFVEIGCGQALPTMAAIACGASDVTVHDFNEEVLTLCALPNIARSLGTIVAGSADVSDSLCVRGAHGDWDGFQVSEPFDVVVGSDVTFDIQACAKVARLLFRLLDDHGVALIGTKEYYFGTNGGAREFLREIELLESTIGNHRFLRHEVVWRTDDLTSGLKRVLIKLWWSKTRE